MADQENELTLEEGGDKGKKKIIVMIVAIVLILLVAVGAYMFLMADDDEPVTEEGTSEQAAGQTAGAGPTPSADMGSAKYVTMPRPFTFNVPGTTRDRLVQIRVQLLVRGDNNEELAQRHIPLIEGTLLKAFSTANADDLATTAGKDALKERAASEVQKAVIGVAGSKIVEEVLFTGFVMQ